PRFFAPHHEQSIKSATPPLPPVNGLRRKRPPRRAAVRRSTSHQAYGNDCELVSAALKNVGMQLPGAPSHIGERRKAGGWQRVRMSVVMPVAIVVAIAIVCVVVAVLTAAHRADEAALDTERELFTRGLANHGERVFREMQPAATSDAAYRRLRGTFDADWAQTYLQGPLQSFFEHDFVFV